eukprot:1161144-Pelagomonas_calceolata.AAC.1
MEALLPDCYCCWRGLDQLCLGVELHKRGSHTHRRAHTNARTHTSQKLVCIIRVSFDTATSTELSPGGRPTGLFYFAAPSWMPGPWQACFGSLRAAGWGIQA